MNDNSAASPPLSLSALRGAVGEVVGGADDLGCWDRMVSIWRIFWALDGLMAALWAIVDRLRSGEGLVGGAPSDERPVVAGLRPVRVRAVTGVRVVSGRRVLTGAVTSVGRVRRGGRPLVVWRSRVLTGVSPVLAVRCRRFSELGWGSAQNCALIVPI